MNIYVLLFSDICIISKHCGVPVTLYDGIFALKLYGFSLSPTYNLAIEVPKFPMITSAGTLLYRKNFAPVTACVTRGSPT